jgi:hypothetical protein
MVEQALALGGSGYIDLLLADGPPLACIKYAKGIDALAPLPPDRLLYQDLQGLARGGPIH